MIGLRWFQECGIAPRYIEMGGLAHCSCDCVVGELRRRKGRSCLQSSCSIMHCSALLRNLIKPLLHSTLLYCLQHYIKCLIWYLEIFHVSEPESQTRAGTCIIILLLSILVLVGNNFTVLSWESPPPIQDTFSIPARGSCWWQFCWLAEERSRSVSSHPFSCSSSAAHLGHHTRTQSVRGGVIALQGQSTR